MNHEHLGSMSNLNVFRVVWCICPQRFTSGSLYTSRFASYCDFHLIYSHLKELEKEVNSIHKQNRIEGGFLGQFNTRISKNISFYIFVKFHLKGKSSSNKTWKFHWYQNYQFFGSKNLERLKNFTELYKTCFPKFFTIEKSTLKIILNDEQRWKSKKKRLQEALCNSILGA